MASRPDAVRGSRLPYVKRPLAVKRYIECVIRFSLTFWQGWYRTGVITYHADWGARRYQQKIFGKKDSDEITASRQKRLHL